MSEERSELTKRIDKIEAGYEFMLAYAAQGHDSDKVVGLEIRQYLKDIDKALDSLVRVVKAVAEEKNGSSVKDYYNFIRALESDANKAQGAVRLVLTQSSISSQLIDNLNASIHLRALLTDLFIIDEAFK